jgi:hypothetical protein
MKARDFCYWLQGYAELNADDITREGLTGKQAKIIMNHLSMVFLHELDKEDVSEAEAEALNLLHKQDPLHNPVGPNGIVYRC